MEGSGIRQAAGAVLFAALAGCAGVERQGPATSEDAIIATAGVSTGANDSSQLAPRVQAVESNTGECVRVVRADLEYSSEEALAILDRRSQRILVAAGREGRKAGRWPRGPFTQRIPPENGTEA